MRPLFLSTADKMQPFREGGNNLRKSSGTGGYTKIMGNAVATAEQMKAYLKVKNPSVAQSCLETGNFTFSGSAVTLSQNNFCGMGVTSNGVKGNSFDTPQLGIRAQVQHLKAYASTEALKNACIQYDIFSGFLAGLSETVELPAAFFCTQK